MSAETEAVTRAHVRYLAERTTPEDAFLADLRRAAVEAGIPPIWIAPEEGAFLRILVRLCGARRLVEVGTLAGYSAVWIARGLPPGGKLTTIEIDPDRAEFARRWVARSDVADRVEVVVGAGADVLRGIADDSADGIFLDADKANYPLYLREGLRIVRRGGLVAADNAFAFGQLFDERPTDREAPAVKAFNEVVARTSGLEKVIVPLGDGLWVGVRL